MTGDEAGTGRQTRPRPGQRGRKALAMRLGPAQAPGTVGGGGRQACWVGFPGLPGRRPSSAGRQELRGYLYPLLQILGAQRSRAKPAARWLLPAGLPGQPGRGPGPQTRSTCGGEGGTRSLSTYCVPGACFSLVFPKGGLLIF